jgi:hypothetical protein
LLQTIGSVEGCHLASAQGEAIPSWSFGSLMKYVNESVSVSFVQSYHARHEKVVSAESVFVYTPTRTEEVGQLYVSLGHLILPLLQS